MQKLGHGMLIYPGSISICLGETRPKRPVMPDLSEIGMIEKHRRKPKDVYVSLDDKEKDQNPYPRVLVILVCIAKVAIPKVLVDTRSALNIFYTSTLKNGWVFLFTSCNHI